MKLLILFLFLTACGDINQKGIISVDGKPLGKEQVSLVENLKDESILFYDFETANLEFVNMDESHLLGDVGDKFASINENGLTNQYIQTHLSLLDSEVNSISFWFKTNSTTAQQTLIWQGPVTQNGFGNGSNNSQFMEFNVNLNHFTNMNGEALQVFYGYNDQNTDPLFASINFPITWNGQATGQLVPLDTSWHHVVIILNKTETEMEISSYYDGVFVQKEAGTQLDTTHWDTLLRFGRPGADTRKFTGNLDSFLWVDKVLTQEQITALFEAGRNI